MDVFPIPLQTSAGWSAASHTREEMQVPKLLRITPVHLSSYTNRLNAAEKENPPRGGPLSQTNMSTQ